MTSAPPRARLFIAADLTDPVRDLIDRVQARLRSALPGKEALLRYVDPAATHITLHFLGPTPLARVDEIGQVIARAAPRQAIALTASGLGAFPGPRSPRVLWLGLEGRLGDLAELQQRIGAGLIALGHVPDGRPFEPHITLARVRDGTSLPERRAIGLAFGQIWEPIVDCPIERLTLYRSDLEKGGPRYTPLHSVALES